MLLSSTSQVAQVPASPILVAGRPVLGLLICRIELPEYWWRAYRTASGKGKCENTLVIAEEQPLNWASTSTPPDWLHRQVKVYFPRVCLFGGEEHKCKFYLHHVGTTFIYQRVPDLSSSRLRIPRATTKLKPMPTMILCFYTSLVFTLTAQVVASSSKQRIFSSAFAIPGNASYDYVGMSLLV